MPTRTRHPKTPTKVKGSGSPGTITSPAGSAPHHGVGTGSTVGAISTSVWATALLQALHVSPKHYAVDIANITRQIGAETAGQAGGFLRDNNPFNLNSYASPHSSLPGGQIVTMTGSGGQTVYVQQFYSVEQGIAAYVDFLKQPAQSGLLHALRTGAPAKVYGAALSKSGWSGQSYANAKVFPTLTPYKATGAVGGQGLTFSPSKGWQSVVNAGKDVGSVVSKPVSSISGLIGDLTNPTKLHDVGLFAAGAALAVVGIAILLSQSKTASLAKAVALK